MTLQLNQRGLSLVDLLVGLGVALIVGGAAVSFVRSQSLAMRTEAGQLDVNDSARTVLEFMAREIRMAGYNPRCTPRANPNEFPYLAVVTAEPQRVRIKYDLNGNGAIDTGAAASEDVTYQYVADNPDDPSDSGTIQRIVGGEVSILATDIPAGGFAFQYFNSNGDLLVGAQGGAQGPGVGAQGGLSLGQAATIARISILLRPEKSSDSRISTRVRSELWSNVMLRNRSDSNKC